MPISLTKEEFLERFAERNKLFQAKIQHDVDQISSLPVYISEDAERGKHLRLGEASYDTIGELIRNFILGAIDLTYSEDI